MFAITRLSKNSQDFLATINQGNKSRSPAASVALARILTASICLPSAPVEDPVNYYRVQCQLEIEQIVNQLNELIVLDRATIADFCMKFYQYRYASVHPANHVFAFNKGTAIEDFFSISRSFDQATLNIIRDDPMAIAGYVNNFARMISELKV